MGVEVAVGELAGGFEPAEEVEVEVVAAGAAVEDEGQDGEERGERDEELVEAVAGMVQGKQVRGAMVQGSCQVPVMRRQDEAAY